MVMVDDGKFKMWFGYGGLDRANDATSARARVGYGESVDGLHWTLTAPVLDVGGMGKWDATNSETPAVVKDESLPDGHPRKYRLYYAGLDHALEALPVDQLLQKGMIYGIGVAFSSDGKSFTRLPASESPFGVDGLVLKPSPPQVDRDMADFLNVSDPFVVRRNGRWEMWYTTMNFVASTRRTFFDIAYATSDDGIHWQKRGEVIKPDLSWERADPEEPHVGRPTVLVINGGLEMFYDAVVPDDNPMKNTARGIGYATSVDGMVWVKQPAPHFVANYGVNERKGIIIGAGVVRKGNSYYLYYQGADPDWNRWVINLATSSR